ELRSQVEAILAQTGAPKVNLVCHSQGALDCRYVANQLGGKIGAAVLVAGVNRGDYVADVASGAVAGPAGDALALLLAWFGSNVLDPNGNPNSNAKAAIAQLTTAGCSAFNAKYPDSPDVAYFSIAGRSNKSFGDWDCGSATESALLEKWDMEASPGKPVLSATAALLHDPAPLSPHH